MKGVEYACVRDAEIDNVPIRVHLRGLGDFAKNGAMMNFVFIQIE
jgi:hypothetical protein